MTTITLNDLPVTRQLDRDAAKAVAGGFLAGLTAYQRPVSSFLPTINNYFVDYTFEHNVYQQNPTNINVVNGPTGGNVVNNIQTSALSAASPMSFTKIAGLVPQQ